MSLLVGTLKTDQIRAQEILISEFMASNQGSLEDNDGDFPDWIELHNPGSTAVNLSGWSLTDDPEVLTKWTFPDLNLPARGYLVVFASGKDRVEPEFHTSFRLAAEGEFLALVRPDGVTIEHGYFPMFPPQKEDYSYGFFRQPDGDPNAYESFYFETPTPGRANIQGFAGFVSDTKFNVNRGFYTEPFDLIISTETEGAEIRYTTDFSEPTETNGTVYSQPISVSTTTIIRAAAFKDGMQPTNVDTQTYLFLEDVLIQPPRHTGWPLTWRNGNSTVPADYEMDPEVIGDPLYQDEMIGALLDIPTISVVTDMGHLFGSSTGIYDNPRQSGVNWERPASVEWILPDQSPGFQVNAGLRIQGGASREPQKSPKHSFRLLFKSQYGPSKLRYTLFPEKTATDTFDTIILRAGFNQSWIHHNNFLGDNRGRAQYVRDQWAKDTQQAMGQPSPHNTYAHLYLNGLYWGLYNPTERPSDDFGSTYFGGDKSEYDVINSGEAVDGNLNVWNQMFNLANSGLADPDRYHDMSNILDIDAFIDFMILNHYGGNMDWDSHNWYASRRRAPEGKFYFFAWDSEFMFINLNDNRINLNDDRRPGRLFTRLKENPEFRIKVADHIHKHFFNQGLLTPEKVIERWEKRSNTIIKAILGESARWGDYRRDVLRAGGPYNLMTRDNQWMQERNRLIRSYFPARTSIVQNQYKSLGWYPQITAPDFDLSPGRVESGTPLTMSAPGGVIYYTTDGTDPRQASNASDSRTTLVQESAPKQIMVPPSAAGSPALSSWTGVDPEFDDAGWTQGMGGVGYDTGNGYQSFIQTDVDREMRGKNTSIYIRIPFTTERVDAFNVMTLKIRYDDGFVAYLNGNRIAAANAPGNLNWNSRATSSHSDASAIQLQSFDVSQALPFLNQGNNILAIHGLNLSLTSSDFLISTTLEVSKVADVEIHPNAKTYSEPIELINMTTINARVLLGNVWSALNSVRFAVGSGDLQLTEIHYHPATSNPEEETAGFTNQDDFEFLEFQNQGSHPIDLTGIRFIDGVDFNFTEADIRHLQPGELVLLVSNRAAFEFRYGTLLPVAGEYSGNLANEGERLSAVDGTDGILFEVDYTDTAPWPEEADGEGPSLELIPDRENLNNPVNWQPSRNRHGSPGRYETSPIQIESIEFKDNQIHLIFQGLPQTAYQIMATDQLTSQNWTVITSGIFDAKESTVEFIDPVSHLTGQRYYKIALP